MKRIEAGVVFGLGYLAVYWMLGVIRHPALGGVIFMSLVGALGVLHAMLRFDSAQEISRTPWRRVGFWGERIAFAIVVPAFVYGGKLVNEPSLDFMSWGWRIWAAFGFSFATYAFLALLFADGLVDVVCGPPRIHEK